MTWLSSTSGSPRHCCIWGKGLWVVWCSSDKIQETLFSVGFSITNNISYDELFSDITYVKLTCKSQDRIHTSVCRGGGGAQPGEGSVKGAA